MHRRKMRAPRADVVSLGSRGGCFDVTFPRGLDPLLQMRFIQAAQPLFAVGTIEEVLVKLKALAEQSGRDAWVRFVPLSSEEYARRCGRAA